MTAPGVDPSGGERQDGVRVEATVYTVYALPGDDLDAHTWCLTVESRGEGQWAVCRMGRTLSRDGRWEHEPIPSSREDDYLIQHRHDLDTALALAREAAAADVLARKDALRAR